MKAHGFEEHFLHPRSCSLVCKKSCAEECRKESAFSCAPFLVQDKQLAEKTSSSLEERRSVDRVVLCQFSDSLACGTDQQLSFLCPGRAHGSIVETSYAAPPKIRLLSSNIRNNIERIGVVEDKLCESIIALVCLLVIAGQKIE